MKNFILMNEHEIASLLESLDDFRCLLERIVDRAKVAAPDPWNDDTREFNLEEVF